MRDYVNRLAELPHVRGLPHLPGVPHLHEYDLKNQADKAREISIILEITRKPNPFFFKPTQPCVRSLTYIQSSPLSTRERSDGWKYVCVRSQTQPRLRDISVFVPFSSIILDF